MPECALAVLSLGVALQLANQVRVRRRTVHFLIGTNLISFCWSCDIVLVMVASAQEMDIPSNSEIQRKICEMLKDFSIKNLPSRGTRRCMLQQMWHTGAWVDWEQKICMLRRNAHRDQPHHRQRAHSLVRTASLIGQIRVGLQSVPQWCYGAPTLRRCSTRHSECTTIHAFMLLKAKLLLLHTMLCCTLFQPPWFDTNENILTSHMSSFFMEQ